MSCQAALPFLCTVRLGVSWPLPGPLSPLLPISLYFSGAALDGALGADKVHQHVGEGIGLWVRMPMAGKNHRQLLLAIRGAEAVERAQDRVSHISKLFLHVDYQQRRAREQLDQRHRRPFRSQACKPTKLKAK